MNSLHGSQTFVHVSDFSAQVHELRFTGFMNRLEALNAPTETEPFGALMVINCSLSSLGTPVPVAAYLWSIEAAKMNLAQTLKQVEWIDPTMMRTDRARGQLIRWESIIKEPRVCGTWAISERGMRAWHRALILIGLVTGVPMSILGLMLIKSRSPWRRQHF